jgi:predicted DNA-binding protein
MQTVRISPDDHKTLKNLSEQTSRTMSELLSAAIAALRKQFILESTNDAYRAMNTDNIRWAAELADRDTWDSGSAAADGDDRR